MSVHLLLPQCAGRLAIYLHKSVPKTLRQLRAETRGDGHEVWSGGLEKAVALGVAARRGKAFVRGANYQAWYDGPAGTEAVRHAVFVMVLHAAIEEKFDEINAAIRHEAKILPFPTRR